MINVSEAERILTEFIVKKQEVASKTAEEIKQTMPMILSLLDEFDKQKELLREKHELTSPYINIFDILKLGHKEMLHSRILGWLFKLDETHEQGSLFLELFAEEYGVSISSATNYEVRLEDADEESRIDIRVLQKNQFMICIENKIFSSEGEDQTLREYRDAKQKAKEYGIDLSNIKCFYLTIDGEAAEDQQHFKSISWYDMCSLIEDYSKKAKSEKVRWFVSQYVESIRNTIKERNHGKYL